MEFELSSVALADTQMNFRRCFEKLEERIEFLTEKIEWCEKNPTSTPQSLYPLIQCLDFSLRLKKVFEICFYMTENPTLLTQMTELLEELMQTIDQTDILLMSAPRSFSFFAMLHHKHKLQRRIRRNSKRMQTLAEVLERICKTAGVSLEETEENGGKTGVCPYATRYLAERRLATSQAQQSPKQSDFIDNIL